MERLELLTQEIAGKSKFVESGADFLGLTSLLTPKENVNLS